MSDIGHRECKTPEKAAYHTRRKAVTALAAIRRRDTNANSFRIYHCDCGAWHLTSKPDWRERYDQPPARMLAQPHRAHRETSQPWDPRRVVVEFKAPKRPKCRTCGRHWLSDLDPTGRSCPSCGGDMVPQSVAA